jgi:hypothetical protein
MKLYKVVGIFSRAVFFYKIKQEWYCSYQDKDGLYKWICCDNPNSPVSSIQGYLESSNLLEFLVITGQTINSTEIDRRLSKI